MSDHDDAESLDRRVRAALSQVYDPCSVAAHVALSIADMGLVRGWELADGCLTVRMCVTFPGCTLAPQFFAAARQRLLELDGITAVDVLLDTAAEWSPEMVSPDGTARLRRLRGRSAMAAPVTRQQWRTVPDHGARPQQVEGPRS